MVLLNKLSSLALTSTLTFLALAASSVNSAEAALFKFSFTSEEANGYFIYDDSIQGTVLSPNSTAYYGAVREYQINSGNGVFEGTNAAAIVFLPRQEDGILAPETDDFLLQESAVEREPQSEFALVSYFHYPKGTFSGSTEIRTSVPSTAQAEIFPNVDFPNTLGEVVFRGNVQTRIERVPEPALIFALLGVSVWFLVSRRQCKDAKFRISTNL
ncbi:PEP-CTERM sorting domain-containing protein [Scytonema sp. UIC 10036]|uniref:PEP-CTERM sorting domain-containing protein n=1 Tax=Scytonema sp. UIC 10036 TaxID=2304196 RepID=UPI0012DAF43C|nr:PEP-CTERM sorting domain-containing protein [Scytonema sp. UIC 10036]MUG91040.1 PEP-CTERM sorting domain-containing protein [Scytonema sp. UIC 10036]